jgi:glycosyltransferase involved in cell wall biosynthesis
MLEMYEPSKNFESITVITVVKNHRVGLLKTIESLKSQVFEEWNSIIVVGASKDSTVTQAQEFAQTDSRITVLLQEDSGIYEAMNIGIAKSKSSLLWFMNAGDTFMDSKSLGSGVEILSDSKCGFIVGGYKIVDQSAVYRQIGSRITPLRFAFTRRGGCHQAMVFRRASVLENGLFDTTFRLAADYDLCLKILKASGAAKSDEIFAVMEPNGRTDNSLVQMHREKLIIRSRHFAKLLWLRPISWSWMYLALTKSSLKAWVCKLLRVASLTET